MPQLVTSSHLSKARLQQPIGSLAQELPLLNSSAAFRLPAVECSAQAALGEVAECLRNLALLLQACVQVTLPGIKSMALGAAGQVRQGALSFGLLVF